MTSERLRGEECIMHFFRLKHQCAVPIVFISAVQFPNPYSWRQEGMSNNIKLKRLETRLYATTYIGEIKEIHDNAEAPRLYVRKAGESLTLQNQYAEVKTRGERRCGYEIDKR
jgi:hypothetical protein